MVTDIITCVCLLGSSCWAAAWVGWALKVLTWKIWDWIAEVLESVTVNIHIKFRRLHDVLAGRDGDAAGAAAGAGPPPPAAPPLALVHGVPPVPPIVLEPCRHRFFSRVGTNRHYYRFSCSDCRQLLLRYPAGVAGLYQYPVEGVHYNFG
jgi:hypothetical protein